MSDQTALDVIIGEVIPRLARIEEQATKTNGRVNALESAKDQEAGYARRLAEEKVETAEDVTGRRVLVAWLVPALVTVVVFVAGVLVSHAWPG